MKNVHILPTDKPSRLFYNVGGALLFTSYENHNGVNIYITSDEEIKDGDWYWLEKIGIIGSESGVYKSSNVKVSKLNTLASNCKKIILTTDQDLINDGVQAIDDDFLQWFVKNPSCEEVEVEKDIHIEFEEVSYEGDFQDVEYIDYKIIIPKEEPEQELEKEMFELEQQLDIPSSMRWYNSKPKQETLEEAAEILYPYDGVNEDYKIDSKRWSFIAGAKWQQERMYSDMQEYAEFCIRCYEKGMPCIIAKDWFEQFKKK